MAAILDAILNFDTCGLLKSLESAFNSFLVPQNICSDTLIMILACQEAKLYWNPYLAAILDAILNFQGRTRGIFGDF